MGDFSERMNELETRVGDGILRGEVEVNQHYALDQHENFSYEHPRGGGPKYLSEPLMENAMGYLGELAAVVLDGDMRPVMIAAMEDLQTELDPRAPIDADPNPIRLRRSGNPKVFDDGEEIYNRPPHDPPEPIGAEKPRYSDRRGD